MTHLVEKFAALGDQTRFAIVERLLREGELSAGQLSDDTKISPPAVSRHLKVLRNAGVISQRVERQKRIYSVQPQAVETISAWADSYRDFWEASIDRLSDALDKEILKK